MNSTAIIARREILNIPIDKISPNPNQPRRIFDQHALHELAESIRNYGVMQPISVRLTPGFGYELVAGERRLRASKLAGFTTIPAVVVNISDQDSALLAVIENMQRENLNFVEEALGFQGIMDDYRFTQEELAQRVGKSQSSVANKLRVLRLPKYILERLVENGLTERHARALLKLPDDKTRADVLDKVIKGSLNVKKTDELVAATLMKMASKKDPGDTGKMRQYIKDIRIFTNTVKQALDDMKNSGIKGEYQMRETEGGFEIIIDIKKETGKGGPAFGLV